VETVDNTACASNRVFVKGEMACASTRVFVNGDMPTQLKYLIQKLIQERRTYVIGAAFVKGCPTLHDDTFKYAELAKLANARLRREWDVTENDFKWNTMHVVPAEDSPSCYDSNFTGKTVNVIVGDDIRDSVLVKGTKQPTVFETSERAPITFEAGKDRMWIVRFGDDKASRQLDGFDLHELGKLGFSSDATYDVAPSDGASNRVRPRSFIHCCCEKGALLSRPFPKDSQLMTLEITQEEDFRSESTIRSVVSKLIGLGYLFFYCSPCCGGSPWQHLNLHLAAKKGWQSTVVRLINHWDLHWRLWSGFMVVAEHSLQESRCRGDSGVAKEL